MRPNIRKIVNKPFAHFKYLDDCVCHSGNYLFEIVESSYCYEKRSLFLKYKVSSQDGNYETYVVESYNINEIEFNFLIQNLFNPKLGEIVPLYENDFVGIKGIAPVYAVHSQLYINTLAIKTR